MIESHWCLPQIINEKIEQTVPTANVMYACMRVYIVKRPIHFGTVTFLKHQLGHPTYTTTLQIQGHFFFQIVGFKFGTQKIVV